MISTVDIHRTMKSDAMVSGVNNWNEIFPWPNSFIGFTSNLNLAKECDSWFDDSSLTSHQKKTVKFYLMMQNFHENYIFVFAENMGFGYFCIVFFFGLIIFPKTRARGIIYSDSLTCYFTWLKWQIECKSISECILLELYVARCERRTDTYNDIVYFFFNSAYSVLCMCEIVL